MKKISGFNLRFKKIMNWIFLILLAIISIGIILAPEKGSETLKKVIIGLKNYRDDANQKAQDLID